MRAGLGGTLCICYFFGSMGCGNQLLAKTFGLIRINQRIGPPLCCQKTDARPKLLAAVCLHVSEQPHWESMMDLKNPLEVRLRRISGVLGLFLSSVIIRSVSRTVSDTDFIFGTPCLRSIVLLDTAGETCGASAFSRRSVLVRGVETPVDPQSDVAA